MTISEKIDKIIADRKTVLPQIEQAEKNLQFAAKTISDLESFRNTIEAEGDSDLSNSLTSLSTVEFNNNYQAALQALESLKQRFSRDKINISFVGRAGQGKSLILQKISGLGGDVIPSADGSDCTGARSIISNNPDSKATTAEISFFNEQEIIGIVNKYLKEILGSDCKLIGSLSAIQSLNINEIRSKLSPDQERQKSLLTHLEKYIEHIHELKDILGTTITVGEEDIERYVAQYKSDDKNIKYYNYLGVKQAVIKSPFPYSDAGKIVLVDTIGTGATSLGVEQEMLATAKNDSDAIVLMKRPEPLRPRLTQDDYDLLRLIRQELTSEYTSKLLFWLFNRVEQGKGANSESIPALMEQMEKEKLAVAKYVNADCSKEDEVRERLLIPLLEQMSSHLPETDQLLINRVNEKLSKAAESFLDISKSLNKAIVGNINPDERRHFNSHIKSTIQKMTDELRSLYIQLNKDKNAICPQLEEISAQKLKNVLLSVPSKEKILSSLNDGTVNQHNILEYYTDALRLQIIDEFLNMDVVLNELVRQAKISIIKILAGDQWGKLGRVNGDEIQDPDLWLERFSSKIEEAQFPFLYSAIKSLQDFKLSVENYLIYKVRASLSTIDWILMTSTPKIINGMDDKEALAEEIGEILRDMLETVHADIRKQLKDYYTFPNEAIFAVTRDFCDRIASKAVSPQTNLSASDEWRYLYEDFIPVIWQEEHMEFGKNAKHMNQWRDVSKNMSECERENYFYIK